MRKAIGLLTEKYDVLFREILHVCVKKQIIGFNGLFQKGRRGKRWVGF